jgi:hypothetical protein
MSAHAGDAPPSARGPDDRSVGHAYGTAFRGAVEGFLRHYGESAGAEVLARLPAVYRPLLTAHAPVLGILATKKYPYAFIGELMRTMQVAVRAPDEDAFIRRIGSWGIDVTLDTVERVLLRYLVSPAAIAQRAPDLWRVFHDCGRLSITLLADHEMHSEVADWPHHDVRVCKLGVEGGRRLFERSGLKNVEAARIKCQTWGHPVCVTRVRW